MVATSSRRSGSCLMVGASCAVACRVPLGSKSGFASTWQVVRPWASTPWCTPPHLPWILMRSSLLKVSSFGAWLTTPWMRSGVPGDPPCPGRRSVCIQRLWLVLLQWRSWRKCAGKWSKVVPARLWFPPWMRWPGCSTSVVVMWRARRCSLPTAWWKKSRPRFLSTWRSCQRRCRRPWVTLGWPFDPMTRPCQLSLRLPDAVGHLLWRQGKPSRHRGSGWTQPGPITRSTRRLGAGQQRRQNEALWQSPRLWPRPRLSRTQQNLQACALRTAAMRRPWRGLW
mmetsp:Transcript_14933/g.33168  ORF Transcript_14933/g.33168 Transcript_14933/m.33168 type:complete len:282 (+) Transcript_14933:56-901(+)